MAPSTYSHWYIGNCGSLVVSLDAKFFIPTKLIGDTLAPVVVTLLDSVIQPAHGRIRVW